MKKRFLEGKLTKISAALLTVFQTPNLLSDLSQSAEAFSINADKPISVLSVAAAAGIIWGGVRRAFNYFK